MYTRGIGSNCIFQKQFRKWKQMTSVNKVSFRGNPSANIQKVAIEEAKKFTETKNLQKEVLQYMPKPVKLLTKMDSFVGEVPNILINAVGTALVAPIFIRYNFLSKTDEDTRTYSAMRQPLSALLAILVQVGAVIPFDMMLNKMSNTGYFHDEKLAELFPDFNKAGFQDVDHLKRIIKKNEPHLSKAEVAAKAEEEQLQQLQKLINSMKEGDRRLSFIDKDGKVVSQSRKTMDKLLKQTTDDLLKDINSNISRHEGVKLEKQVNRGEFLRNNHNEVNSILDEIDTKAKSVKNQGELASWFKSKAKDLKKNQANQELIDIVNDIADRMNIETIKEKVQDVRGKCDKFKGCSDKKEVFNKVFDEIEASKAEFVEEKKVIGKIREALFSGKSLDEIFTESKALKQSDFLYDVAMKYTKNVASNIKGLKQVTGILLGLITLPISCSLLNWVYPKFMEAAFPNLTKNKRSQEKDKFIKNSTTPLAAQTKVDEKKAKEVK